MKRFEAQSVLIQVSSKMKKKLPGPMNIKSFLLPGAATLILSAASALAQGYPQVPKDIMDASLKERAEAAKLSDEAFQRAQPEIEAWAKKGKPYIPGAAKPEDLPQAKIPAFPGAWGGGMYSFGGRGDLCLR